MLYIVEIPHRLPATVWAAVDEAEFIRRCHAHHAQSRSGATIFEQLTPRQLLERAGATPETADREDCAVEFDLATAYGWDTVLTLAEYSMGDGAYEANATVTEFEACCDYIEHDLAACYVFKTEAEAVEGYQDQVQDMRALHLLRTALEKAGAMTPEATVED